MRYYLDSAIRFCGEMAEVLCVYREVKVLRRRRYREEAEQAVAIVSTTRSPVSRRSPRLPRPAADLACCDLRRELI